MQGQRAHAYPAAVAGIRSLGCGVHTRGPSFPAWGSSHGRDSEPVTVRFSRYVNGLVVVRALPA